MKYRLAIFDFDGTLADSGRWFLAVLNDLAPRHGFRAIADAGVEMLRGLGNREIICPLGVARWRMPFIAADFRRRAAADAAHAVGAVSGAVAWGYATRELLMRCQPTLSFDHPMDILGGVGGIRFKPPPLTLLRPLLGWRFC